MQLASLGMRRIFNCECTHEMSLKMQAEAEAAVAEGRKKTQVHLENGHVLEVHPGAATERDAADGKLYALTWAQDADGALSVSFHFLFLRFSSIFYYYYYIVLSHDFYFFFFFLIASLYTFLVHLPCLPCTPSVDPTLLGRRLRTAFDAHPPAVRQMGSCGAA